MQKIEMKNNQLMEYFPASALVSALVDGAIPKAALPKALARVAASADLARTWGRYYLLREALHGGIGNYYDIDLEDNILKAIAENPWQATVPPVKAPAKPVAIFDCGCPAAWWPAWSLAAALTFVLVFWPAFTETQSPVLATLPKPLPAAIVVQPLTPKDLDAEWQALLREHAAYQEVLPSILPYTRMPILRTASAY